MSKPWMPLYVADYLADTAHLRAAQSGAYLHLIMHYWRKGGLPDDDAQLAAIAKMDDNEWVNARSIIQAFFHDGWRHKRIDAELEKSSEVSKNYSERAKTAANARWSNKNNASSIPQAIPEQCLDMPISQSQSHKGKEKKEMRANARRTRGSRLPLNWTPDEAAVSYAQKLRVDVSEESERFRDYWHARAGPGGVKLDWAATWRTWCRNALKFNGTTGNGQNQKPPNRFRAALDKLRDSIETDGSQEMRPNAPRLISSG